MCSQCANGLVKYSDFFLRRETPEDSKVKHARATRPISRPPPVSMNTGKQRDGKRNGAESDRARNKLPQRSAGNMRGGRRTLMHPRDLPVYLLCSSQYREIEMRLVAVLRPVFLHPLSFSPILYTRAFFSTVPGYFIQRHSALSRRLILQSHCIKSKALA